MKDCLSKTKQYFESKLCNERSLILSSCQSRKLTIKPTFLAVFMLCALRNYCHGTFRNCHLCIIQATRSNTANCCGEFQKV